MLRPLLLAMLLAIVFPGLRMAAQDVKTTTPESAPSPVDRNAAGDSPDNPGPMATDLSSRLTTVEIHKAMRKVADWQLATGESRFNQQWTYAALYDGLLEASRSTGDPKYKDAVLHMAERFGWQMIQDRFPHADDEAIGRAYLELYVDHPSPERAAVTKETMDRLAARPDDPKKLLWWWCDALFMAPPVLARLSAITGDKKYLDFMDREWNITSQSLYDPQERLFFRDDRYFTKKEANGQKLFWARGNGWVLAGLATILQTMPADYRGRARYVAQFRAMAERVAGLQQSDGLWRSGLLDPKAYAAPEVSGSAFFAYAMAWGVNNRLLDRKKYMPVITHAWQGMIGHIYADGRLGSIQPIDAAPGAVKASSSYVYGVGAFLLAGSELAKMNSKRVVSSRYK